ncbi:Gfo/Idh/MocA family protein [Bailinhaonella thermotolerans]|uniref:Gfo/Idh/MocA family protein n=1 Tax=Bailinhaonella thermotolerans TaxID=1070861 RepID=UPI00192A2BAF|nr:Gfo/Idh/MocA family oxidoreductase [Bailinhaonella thermotolerans]
MGLVGAGNVAARHADVLAEFPDVRLAAVTDLSLERAAGLAERHGAAVYPHHGDMLERERLDAVYICLPPFAHGPVERAVIEAGLPFFVEKPIAIDLGTAESIAALARSRGVLSAVGHQWRYLDVVQRARELLDGRAVRLALGHWLDKVPPVDWWGRRDGSGGQVVEQAAHVIDLARLLVGEVAAVRAVESEAVAPGGDVAAATVAALRFENGAVGSLAATCLLGWKHRAGLEVYADGLALEISETSLRVFDGDGEPELVEDEGAAKRRVDRAFVDAVLGIGNDVRTDYEDALRTHRVACEIAASAREVAA